MRLFIKSIIILFCSFSALAQPMGSERPQTSWDEEKIEVKKGVELNTILSASSIISEGWSDLAQPIFWKEIMGLSPDSCLINIAASRVIVARMSKRQWNAQSDIQKSNFRDSVRNSHQLDSKARIYVTTGKSDFYKFETVYPSISKGVEEFEKHGVDPWYAQAILLIESPGQLKKSKAGAYGPFQLMPSVARAQGLKVTRSVDERENFERSAYGAARLINRVCIPEAKRILNAKGLKYTENDIWFRLFVLHVYHAGSANVHAVVNKIRPKEGGQELIKAMWQNTAANFGNNSQNYSQLALASQLILHDMVYADCDYILECNHKD
jgi:Transglycosylase SLT domain